MKLEDLLNVILNADVTSEVVCTQKPVGVMNAAVFIVNTTKLRHPDDLKADDMGSYVHIGKSVRYYTVDRLPTGEVYRMKHYDESSKGAFSLTRIYYHHKGTSECRKTFMLIVCRLLFMCTVCVYVYGE